MGCTAAELIGWLSVALPGAVLEADAATGHANALFADGNLSLNWHTLPARRIAFPQIPRLRVRFQYSDMPAERRHEVQRRFDLAIQRGGG